MHSIAQASTATPNPIEQRISSAPAQAADAPDRWAVTRAWSAIEAVFRASEDPEMTRKALREFVDLTADKTKLEVQV